MFVARFRESNFLRFVVFSASLTFATYRPFFAVFMLRDLLSYLTYMALQVCSSFASLVALPLWGKHADLVGNVRVLRLSSFFAALIPIFWLFSHDPAYLMLIQIWGGFSWSGVTLSAANFIYDVTPQKRIRCIAYFNVINGVASRLFTRRFSCLAVAAAFRLSSAQSFCSFLLLPSFLYLLLSRSFREVRPAHEFPSTSCFSASSAFVHWWGGPAIEWRLLAYGIWLIACGSLNPTICTSYQPYAILCARLASEPF